jgi:ribosome-associated toxin RatA of RatAB toxin-antitoxin module
MGLSRSSAGFGCALRRAAPCSLLILLLTGSPVERAWSAASIRLSDEQQRRLTAREVIVLDALPPQASKSAHGGTALALVRAAPERVWRILVDYPGHTRYYPRVTAVQVLEADERHALVRYEVGVGPFSFGFHMMKYPDPIRRRIEWQLAEGRPNSLFRENSGYWQLDEAPGGSLVTYALAVRTILPAFATLGSERDSLVGTVTSLRRLAEEGDAGGR